MPIVISGCAIGLGIGYWAAALAGHYAPQVLPVPNVAPLTIAVGPMSMFWAFVACAFALVLAAVSPAVAVTRRGPAPGLLAGRATPHRPSRAMMLLIGPQIAMSVAVLSLVPALAVIVFRSAANDPGYDPGHAVWATIDLEPYGLDATARAAYLRRVRDLVDKAGTPIGALAVATWPSPDGFEPILGLTVPGSADSRTHLVSVFYLEPNAFKTAGFRIVDGRSFRDSEPAGAIILDQHTARDLWPEISAIGRELRVNLGETAEPASYRVVGVLETVADLPVGSRRDRIYLPIEGRAPTRFNVLARVDKSPEASIDIIRPILVGADTTIAARPPRTLRSYNSSLGFSRRAALIVLTGFGGLGLAITVIGVFAVTKELIEARRQEIAIRLVVGGHMGAIVARLVRPLVLVIGTGLLAGTALALSASKTQIPFAASGHALAAGLALVCAVVVLSSAVGAGSAVLLALRAEPGDLLRGRL